MKEKFELTTPILFLVFNRLDTTKKVFAEIRKARPKKLFIAADGPRTKEEKRETDAVRKYILDNIDWPCRVKKLFRKKNLGCRYASNGAIDWFFENVEEGLVLEDDTVPSKSYFRFIQEILEKYKDNKRVMSVCGYSPFKKLNLKESYYFFREFGSWGCAMWKRSWEKQDLDLKNYLRIKEEGNLSKYFPNIVERILWKKRVGDTFSGRVSSWSYCFNIAHILNNGLCVLPKVNLIKNIGFDERSTHTTGNKIDMKFIDVSSGEISFPLIHPNKIELNKKIARRWLLRDIKRIILKKLFWGGK